MRARPVVYSGVALWTGAQIRSASFEAKPFEANGDRHDKNTCRPRGRCVPGSSHDLCAGSAPGRQRADEFHGRNVERDPDPWLAPELPTGPQRLAQVTCVGPREVRAEALPVEVVIATFDLNPATPAG